MITSLYAYGAILVNTHTHKRKRYSLWPALLLAQPAELKRRMHVIYRRIDCAYVLVQYDM